MAEVSRHDGTSRASAEQCPHRCETGPACSQHGRTSRMTATTSPRRQSQLQRRIPGRTKCSTSHQFGLDRIVQSSAYESADESRMNAGARVFHVAAPAPNSSGHSAPPHQVPVMPTRVQNCIFGQHSRASHSGTRMVWSGCTCWTAAAHPRYSPANARVHWRCDESRLFSDQNDEPLPRYPVWVSWSIDTIDYSRPTTRYGRPPSRVTGAAEHWTCSIFIDWT
jgi:hypothetical protein